jgi:cell division protein FtsB
MRRPLPHDRRFSPVLLGCLALSAYFVHHTFYGKHGLMSRTRLIERAEIADRALARAEARRAALRHDVALLSTEPPHRDVVAEEAMAVLGYGLPGDRTAPLRAR